jgi:hypothetical protein
MFKRNYQVKFPVIHTQDYKLVFSSATKECFVPWGDKNLWDKKGKVKQKGSLQTKKKKNKKDKILKHEDYYWI